MMDNSVNKQILAAYENKRELYEDFVSVLKELLKSLLDKHSIQVQLIEGRVKSQESLAAKLTRKGGIYRSLQELPDLAGIRIITYLEEDVARVSKIITTEFEIESSSDKRRFFGDDQFGYLSPHYVLHLSPVRSVIPSYEQFRELKFEVQVRSILQQAWFEIEHNLGYRSEAEVPEGIKRRFARIAGLLELTDQEFERIKLELDVYRRELSTSIRESPEEVLLDVDSLEEFSKSELVTNLDDVIAATVKGSVNKTEHLPNSYTSYFHLLGIITIGNIAALLESRKDETIQFAKRWVVTEGIILSRGISIYYLWLSILSSKKVENIISILEQSEVKRDAISMANRIFEAGGTMARE